MSYKSLFVHGPISPSSQFGPGWAISIALKYEFIQDSKFQYLRLLRLSLCIIGFTQSDQELFGQFNTRLFLVEIWMIGSIPNCLCSPLFIQQFLGLREVFNLPRSWKQSNRRMDVGAMLSYRC